MSERPNLVLGLLVSLGLLTAGILVVAFAALEGCGIAGVAATVAGALSACVVFLHEVNRMPLGTLVVGGLLLASLIACLRAFAVSLRERSLLRRIPLERVGQGKLSAIVEAAGARGLYLLPARRPAAFCCGLLRVNVVVTSGLLARLEPDEQAAAVWHEAYHARSREPLKCLLARLTTRTFFWIPALRDLLERYLLAKELAADRLAVDRTSRRALAGALCEVVGQRPVAGTVGLADLAAARVDRLFDPQAELPPLFRRRRLAISAAGAVALGLLVSLPAQIDLTESRHLWAVPALAASHVRPALVLGVAMSAAIVAGHAVAERLLRRRTG